MRGCVYVPMFKYMVVRTWYYRLREALTDVASQLLLCLICCTCTIDEYTSMEQIMLLLYITVPAVALCNV